MMAFYDETFLKIISDMFGFKFLGVSSCVLLRFLVFSEKLAWNKGFFLCNDSIFDQTESQKYNNLCRRYQYAHSAYQISVVKSLILSLVLLQWLMLSKRPVPEPYRAGRKIPRIISRNRLRPVSRQTAAESLFTYRFCPCKSLFIIYSFVVS